jgi:hypothetical protein
MGIGIIFTGFVVLVRGALRGESFEEGIVVLEQPSLVVVDVHAGRDVHGVDQHESFPDAALLHGRFHVRRDIQIRPPCLGLEPEFFAVGLHG